MAIHIKEAFPLLETILRQQQDISTSLDKLIITFKRAPEPVEPTLRLMLQPIGDRMTEMKETLLPISSADDSSEKPSE